MKQSKLSAFIQSKRGKGLVIVCFITTVLFALLFYAIPFTLDDWNWGGVLGEIRLNRFFAGYNGRYLGNLTVYFATRSIVFRVLIMTVVTQIMCIQVAKISVPKLTVPYYLLSVVLIFCSVLPAFVVPKLNIFSQTIGWISGFSNYVVPMVFVLAYAVGVKKYYLNPDLKSDKTECIVMLVCGICSCLFLETVTAFCVIASGIINFYFFVKRNKKIYPAQAMYFAGSVVGAMIMLSNSSYWHMLDKSYVEENTVESNFRSIGFVNSSILDEFSLKMNMSAKVLIVMVIFMIIALAALFIIPFIVTKNKNQRLFLLAQLVSIVALTVPLLFANGSHNYLLSTRVYFAQYIFAVIYVVALINIFISGKNINLKRLGKAGVALVFCAMTVMFATAYIPIHNIYSASDKYIRQQIESGASSIEVIKYPDKYCKYVFSANVFETDGWAPLFKQYYNIDENTELISIDYSDYVQNEQK